MRFRASIPVTVLVLGLLAASGPAQQIKGFQGKVKVGAATRIDWTFALSNRSLDKPPANWLPGDYDSAKQQYDLFVPPTYNPKQSYPVVLFISAGDGPAGWSQWEPVSKQQGIIFASPHGAGNNVDFKKRVRVVLDVLDDVRKNYNTDPDRTYISGFSGGGRVAGHIAFSFPDYFGGAIPVCATGDFREETWLQHRMIDRLSVALVTGETDFNRGECERFKNTWQTEIGVRTKVWVVSKMGHGIPGGTTLAEVFTWLEEGLARRRELAKNYPAMRVAGNAAPSRQEQASALLAEGKQRLQAKETTYSGLMLLDGCAIRWSDTPAGAEALKITQEYDAKASKPWEEEHGDFERRFVFGRARGLDAYASGPLPPQYAKQQGDMAKAAIQMYERLLKDGKYPKAVDEAKKRIPELRKLLMK
jgi:poly(3-hydroxybutyrate) depolymerase